MTSETRGLLLCAFISPCSTIKILSLGLISPSFIPLYTLLNGLGLILITCKMALPSGVTVARDRATHNYLSRFSIASDVQLLTTYKTIDHELSYFVSDKSNGTPKYLLSRHHGNRYIFTGFLCKGIFAVKYVLIQHMYPVKVCHS